MNELIDKLKQINEYTFNDLRVKQRSIGKLFPSFGSRVKAVASNGGVSMKEQMPDYWHFQVASGTKPGVKYDVYVQFVNLEEMIKKFAGDPRLWNQAQDNVDYRLLAAEILNKVDMRTSCSCPATLYWGQDFIRTARDAQFHDQEYRSPNIRNPRQYGAYCKHGQLVFNVLPAYTSTFASFLKKFWAGEVQDTVDLAKETRAGVSKAAGALAKREEERPRAYTKGGKVAPLPKAAPPGTEPGAEPSEEEPPKPPAGEEEEVEEAPPENIATKPATKFAGKLPGKGTHPAGKKLGVPEEERPEGPEDKGKKGKYKPKE